MLLDEFAHISPEIFQDIISSFTIQKNVEWIPPNNTHELISAETYYIIPFTGYVFDSRYGNVIYHMDGSMTVL